MSGRPLAYLALSVSAVIIAAVSASALDEPGRKAGKLAGEYATQKLKTKSDIETKVKMPLTDENTPLKNLEGTKQGSGVAFCGQGDIKDQKEALKVTLTASSVTVVSDTNNDGIVDDSNYASITKICTEGIQSGTTYYRWSVTSSGAVDTIVSPPLAGCVSPESAPPSYAGGKIAQLYADATGKHILGGRAKGETITYYTGAVKDCSNQQKDLSATRYYSNPYAMESDAAATIASCGGSTSETCLAYQGITNANTNYSGSGSGTVTCSITRNVVDSNAPLNGIICERNKVYFANGYSEQNKYCKPGTMWDYSSQIALRCDPYGKAVSAEGWASWEGAPCGGGYQYPPDVQTRKQLSYGSGFPDTVIGRLSVNYREDGPNTSANDMSVDLRCYSDVHPLTVHVSSACAADKAWCDFTFVVDNAPSCQQFVVRLDPPVGENIADGCQMYQSNLSCDLKEEKWFDANSNAVTVISGSIPTHNEPAETCKTFPTAGVVCRPWWKKDRTYMCQTTSSASPDVARPAVIQDSTKLTGTTITYNSPECTAGTDCKVEVWDHATTDPESDCEIACIVKRIAGADKRGNSTYDYESKICDKQVSGSTVTYLCPTAAGDMLVKDCGCLDMSGQAIGVLGAVYETTKDRECAK